MENYGGFFIRNYVDLIKVFILYLNIYIVVNFEKKIKLSYMNIIWFFKRVLFIKFEEFLIDYFYILVFFKYLKIYWGNNFYL